MKITIDVVDININIRKRMNQVRSDKFGTYAATSWNRLYSPYVPFETGALQDTIRITPWQIEHTVPYAAPMYYGNFNFKKTYHPKASRMWDKAAAPTQAPILHDELQAFVDKGGLNLGD